MDFNFSNISFYDLNSNQANTTFTNHKNIGSNYLGIAEILEIYILIIIIFLYILSQISYCIK